MEHGGDLWRRLRDGQILGRLRVVAALEVVGHVAVLSQEGEELQQEVAEVLPNAKPPCKKIRRAQLNSAATKTIILTFQRPQAHKKITFQKTTTQFIIIELTGAETIS